jgi:peptidoglycan/LPS O-acetylase OafA/YrhL
VTDAPTVPKSTASLGYRPALDGVRGIAIALVVLFHYPWGVRNPFKPFGNDRVPGGFLGVDAFFVLSGFLITTLLLQERVRLRRINLRNFYARRAFRLLPALAVLFVIALILHFRLPAGDANRPQTTGLLGVVFYVANWVNIYRPKALGITADTWSLAIEEQFYVLWPMIVILLLRRRMRTGALAALAAVGIAGSATWRAWYWYHREGGHAANVFIAYARAVDRVGVWNRIYFGSDTRADTLLMGCLTAILLFWLAPRVTPRVRAWMSAGAVAALAVAALIVVRATVVVSGWLPEWGFLAFEASVAVLIAGLVIAPHGPLARSFAFRPLVWLGRRSYAIYLFHQLVYVYLGRSRVHLPAPASLVFQMVAILVVAELSHRFIEAPMLRRKRRVAPEPSDARGGYEMSRSMR